MNYCLGELKTRMKMLILLNETPQGDKMLLTVINIDVDIDD